jgi:hypothetical protein
MLLLVRNAVALCVRSLNKAPPRRLSASAHSAHEIARDSIAPMSVMSQVAICSGSSRSYSFLTTA